MAMLRRRGKRWQWRVTRKGFPTQYGTCPSRECAKVCAADAEKRLRQGRGAVKMPLAEAIALFEESHLPSIPDSAHNYRAYLAFWRDEIGDLDVAAVTAPVIAQARARLGARPGRGAKKLSATTVNHYVTALSAVFRWAMQPEQGFVDRNPVGDVVQLKEPKARVRFLSRPTDEKNSEIERLLAACRESESEILHDVVILLLSTGCRMNEVMTLERRDVRVSEGGFTLPAERTKTETARFVPLEGKALDVVRRRLALPTFGSKYLFPGRRPSEPAGFPRTAWRSALRRAEISNFRVHDLRHTYLSYLAMLGHTLPEIMAAGGHADAKSALRYIHLADERKRAVARSASDAMKGWLQGDAGSS